MKAARFPLYAKILLWFFLNLLVLAILAVVVLRVQFGSAPELLTAGPAGDRLEAMSRVIREELVHQQPPQWDAILERFSKAYGVQLYLFRNDGGQAAGPKIELPTEVLERFLDRRRRGPFFERGPLRERGRFRLEGRPLIERETEDRVESFDGPRLDEERRRRGPPPEDLAGRRGPGVGGPMPRIRFALRTEKPNQYWIGMPTPVPTAERDAEPGTLILATPSIRAGGLLLDTTGWIWIGAGALLFSVVFWLPLVRSLTRAISQMRGATADIAEGNFDVRVDEKRRDELGLLGAGINRMATRLRGFVTGQKRFLGDIAHELCSPLARMQVALGILEERADEKQTGYINDVKEEVQHMSGLVNELLSFSKASLGSSNLRIETIELRPVVEQAIKREQQPGAEIRNEVAPGLTVSGDAELIVRAVSNLLRNSVRYAADQGPISVSARQDSEHVALSITDEGPGVPEDELPKLFDPFYRVDQSRTRETGGAGLGLAIVKTCIEACGGTVTCRNRHPRGFEVALRLPNASSRGTLKNE